MEGDVLRLRVLTPERTVFEGDVGSVLLRSVQGEFQVLPGHEPLIAPLAIHKMMVKGAGGKKIIFAVHGGMLQVKADTVTVLADAAELAEEIDVARAREAGSKARGRLEGGDDSDTTRALRALLRAQLRLEAADSRK